MLLFSILFIFFPAALWAGAITPALSTTGSTELLALPSFSNSTGLEDDGANIKAQTTAQCIFTYAPESDLWGLIMNAAQDASSRNGGTSSHAKLDKTGYIYPTRSYGIGVSVGLTDKFLERVTSYTYNETGYLVYIKRYIGMAAECLYGNTSILPALSLFGQVQVPVFFTAEGRLPNGFLPPPAIVSAGSHGAVAMVAGTQGDDTSTSHYVAFVAINVINHTISVFPIPPADKFTNTSKVTYPTVAAIENLEPSL